MNGLIIFRIMRNGARRNVGCLIELYFVSSVIRCRASDGARIGHEKAKDQQAQCAYQSRGYGERQSPLEQERFNRQLWHQNGSISSISNLLTFDSTKTAASSVPKMLPTEWCERHTPIMNPAHNINHRLHYGSKYCNERYLVCSFRTSYRRLPHNRASL